MQEETVKWEKWNIKLALKNVSVLLIFWLLCDSAFLLTSIGGVYVQGVSL